VEQPPRRATKKEADMQKIMPCLWFDDRIEDAVNFYTSVFPKSKITTILTMSEFKDAMAGFRFQSTGELVSPIGASLVRSDEVPTDKVVGMDKRFAAEEVITQPLTVEYDKIIEQRFEEAVISESIAYAKVIPEAVKVLDSVWP
jgi:hypothetical protein